MRITGLYPSQPGVSTGGLPFAKGALFPGEGLSFTQNGHTLPLWWQARAFWDDGSVKWIFYHAQAAQRDEISVLPCATGAAAQPRNPSVPQTVGESERLEAGKLTIALGSDCTSLAGSQTAACYRGLRLLEDSPIAPLYGLDAVGKGLAVEYRVRLYPALDSAEFIRRVTVLEDTQLRSSSLAVETNAGYHQCVAQERRAPSRVLRAENGALHLILWPEGAGAVKLSGGTALRQTVRLSLREPFSSCSLDFEPGYLAATRALGSVYTPGDDMDRAPFPGFDQAYRRLLDSGLDENTAADPAYLGLLHDGDWPLAPGQYGAEAYRCYADNEYDTAFAYYLGYAGIGDARYREVARRCAAHMADVDCDQRSGDMHYHGYSENAENHSDRRSGGDNGHYWSDGMWLAWFLEGDEFCRRSALALTRYVIDKIGTDAQSLRREFSVCERNLGWPLVTVMAALEAGGAPPQAEAFCEAIVSFADAYTADPDAAYCLGGEGEPVWWRTAMQDGSKPFMLGVLMEGLERAHRLFGWEKAAGALLRIARYVVQHTFDPYRACFAYEVNAFGRGHRGIVTPQLSPLVLRGLAYAYGLSGEETLRTAAMQAFHACLWTLYDPKLNGKDIALIGRNLSAFACAARGWLAADEEARFALPPSGGGKYGGDAVPKSLCWSSDAGELSLWVRFAPGSTDYLNQRAIVHLCGEAHNGPAVSAITFYRTLSVRFYDAKRRLITSLDASLDTCTPGGWREGEKRFLKIRWHAPGEAELWLDSVLLDRQALNRPLSGAFTSCLLGEKPGNWRLKGEAQIQHISIGDLP